MGMMAKRSYPDLNTWREDQELSQRQAAERFGISQPQWCRIETGKLTPKGELLKRLMRETGVPLETLVGIAS